MQPFVGVREERCRIWTDPCDLVSLFGLQQPPRPSIDSDPRRSDLGSDVYNTRWWVQIAQFSRCSEIAKCGEAGAIVYSLAK